MLAARLYGTKDLRVETVDKPLPGSRDILLKVRSAFICGTDIRMFQSSYHGTNSLLPLILGHEISGIIEQVGSDVSGYQPGTRVTVAPNMGCGICKMCISGQTHLCPDYNALGINLDGGFAEYVRIPEDAVRQGNIVEIPDHVSFGEAALIEPFSCVYSGFVKCDIRPGDSVLIVGAGPIGMMHCKLANMAGAAKVFLNDLSQNRLQVCRKINTSCDILSGGDLKKQVMEATDGEGVDVCITACPSVAAQEASLEMMAINGRVLFFGGLPAGTKAMLDTNLIHYKQLMVTGTTRASLSHYRKALDLVSSGLITLGDLITRKSRIIDFSEILSQAQNASGLKEMIEFV